MNPVVRNRGTLTIIDGDIIAERMAKSEARRAGHETRRAKQRERDPFKGTRFWRGP